MEHGWENKEQQRKIGHDQANRYVQIEIARDQANTLQKKMDYVRISNKK